MTASLVFDDIRAGDAVGRGEAPLFLLVPDNKFGTARIGVSATSDRRITGLTARYTIDDLRDGLSVETSTGPPDVSGTPQRALAMLLLRDGDAGPEAARDASAMWPEWQELLRDVTSGSTAMLVEGERVEFSKVGIGSLVIAQSHIGEVYVTIESRSPSVPVEALAIMRWRSQSATGD